MRGIPAKRRSFRPDDTTPFARKSRGSAFGGTLFWMIALSGIAWMLVTEFGLPGLRFQYTYTGSKEARFDQVCWYLTIDGFRRVVPPPGLNQCGLIRLFPL